MFPVFVALSIVSTRAPRYVVLAGVCIICYVLLSLCGRIVLLYVDDKIIAGDDPTRIQSVKETLHGQFKMKDRPLRYFLGN